MAAAVLRGQLMGAEPPSMFKQPMTAVLSQLMGAEPPNNVQAKDRHLAPCTSMPHYIYISPTTYCVPANSRGVGYRTTTSSTSRRASWLQRTKRQHMGFLLDCENGSENDIPCIVYIMLTVVKFESRQR